MDCPKCKSGVQAAGTAVVNGDELTVYQCDRCKAPWRVGEATFDVALTFAVDAAGRFYDPNSGDLLSLN